MKRLAGWVWTDGRFAWWLVIAVACGTLFVLWFDWYWRTHDTNFSRLF